MRLQRGRKSRGYTDKEGWRWRPLERPTCGVGGELDGRWILLVQSARRTVNVDCLGTCKATEEIVSVTSPIEKDYTILS